MHGTPIKRIVFLLYYLHLFCNYSIHICNENLATLISVIKLSLSYVGAIYIQFTVFYSSKCNNYSVMLCPLWHCSFFCYTIQHLI